MTGVQTCALPICVEMRQQFCNHSHGFITVPTPIKSIITAGTVNLGCEAAIHAARLCQVRTAVALILGTTLYVPHPCRCGAQVDAYGVHSLVCKRASGKITRHQAHNDVIARAFVAADMPVTEETNGLLIADCKRPDGPTLLPWHEGKPLA